MASLRLASALALASLSLTRAAWAQDAPPPQPSRAAQMRKLSERLDNEQTQLDEQKATIERLEPQLAHPPPPPPPPPEEPAIGLAEPAADGAEGRETEDDPRKKLLIYGYAQGQFQVDQSSENVTARPASTYHRFGIAFDGTARVKSRLGETELAGALYFGSNLDRGLFISDPVLLGRDTRHIGYMLSVIQEAGDWFVVGFRTDYYNPDSDSSDFENAKPVQPNDRSIRTYSPLIGVRYDRPRHPRPSSPRRRPHRSRRARSHRRATSRLLR